MCITKKEILELNDVIENINDFSNIQERDLYLKDIVEDVDLFINTLKKIKKNKLSKNRKSDEKTDKTEEFSEKMIIDLFKSKKVDEIVKDYTKQQLTDMYITFYSEKPLTSFDKRKIALTIYHSIYSMGRTKTLLG